MTLLADGVGGPGIQFDNMLDPTLTKFGISFAYLWMMLVVSVVYLFLFAFYMNQVVPNEWGESEWPVLEVFSTRLQI